MCGPCGGEDCRLLVTAHNVDQLDAILDADAVQHLAQIGGRSGVNQCGMAFQLHRLDHRQCRQRIDEAGCCVFRGRISTHHEALGDIERTILAVHRTAETADSLAKQCLCGC